jgi:hypothetical protein
MSAFTFSYADDADEAVPGVEYDPDMAHDDVLMDLPPSPVIGKATATGKRARTDQFTQTKGKGKGKGKGKKAAAAAGGGGDAADDDDEAPATKKPRGPGRCALVVERVGEEFESLAKGGSEARFWKQTCMVLADHFLAPHLEPPKHAKRKNMEHLVKALHTVSRAVRKDAIAALNDDVQRHIVRDVAQNPFVV